MMPRARGLVFVAIIVNLRSVFTARTKVDEDAIEPGAQSHSYPPPAKVTDVVAGYITDAVANEPVVQSHSGLQPAKVTDAVTGGITDVVKDAVTDAAVLAEDWEAPWPSLWLPFGESLPVMFAVMCIVYSLWMFGFYGHVTSINKRLEVIDDHTQEFHKAYDAFTSATVGVLNSVSESAALVAERGFEAKRRHLLNHMRRIREHPETVGHSSCAPFFWQLIAQWSAVFRECVLWHVSIEDADDELPDCATIERVAELSCERLESMSASSVARQLETFMVPLTHQDLKALEGSVKSGIFPLTFSRGDRVIITLISEWHSGLLLAFFTGLAVAGVEIAAKNWWLAAAVFCASACLLGDLLRYEKIDRMCGAESEMRKLRLQSCAARRHHEQVAAFYKELESVTPLWLHRTTPQLEIFGELFDVLWAPPAGSTDVSLLPSVAEKMARMRGSLGPSCVWHGKGAVSVEQLQIIAGTLCTCADFIKGQQVEAKAERLPAVVHYLENMELPNFSLEAQFKALS